MFKLAFGCYEYIDGHSTREHRLPKQGSIARELRDCAVQKAEEIAI